MNSVNSIITKGSSGIIISFQKNKRQCGCIVTTQSSHISKCQLPPEKKVAELHKAVAKVSFSCNAKSAVAQISELRRTHKTRLAPWAQQPTSVFRQGRHETQHPHQFAELVKCERVGERCRHWTRSREALGHGLLILKLQVDLWQTVIQSLQKLELKKGNIINIILRFSCPCKTTARTKEIKKWSVLEPQLHSIHFQSKYKSKHTPILNWQNRTTHSVSAAKKRMTNKKGGGGGWGGGGGGGEKRKTENKTNRSTKREWNKKNEKIAGRYP